MLGDGCVYPQPRRTLVSQLEAKKLTWRAYIEGLGDAPKSKHAARDLACDARRSRSSGLAQTLPRTRTLGSRADPSTRATDDQVRPTRM